MDHYTYREDSGVEVFYHTGLKMKGIPEGLDGGAGMCWVCTQEKQTKT